MGHAVNTTHGIDRLLIHADEIPTHLANSNSLRLDMICTIYFQTLYLGYRCGVDRILKLRSDSTESI